MIGVTKNFDTWVFQESHVERMLDNAAYTAAHPDDTLLLAGPCRRANLKDGGAQSLLALGMMQSFQMSQTKPTQPMMAIGSGRLFYTSGKAQTSWTMGRILMNGRNLLRALYHSARSAGIDPSRFDDPACSPSGSQQFYLNLDSELYLIPIGLGAVIRDKSHGYVGGGYLELCCINSYSLAIAAGQNMALESVTGLADRILPFGEGSATRRPNAGNAPILEDQLNRVLGFIDTRVGDVQTEDIGNRQPQPV